MRNLILVLIVVVCSANCCNNEAYREIYIHNKSDKTIYYGVGYSYPDTNLIQINAIPGHNGNISHRIEKGKQGVLMAAQFSLNPTLQLFIFDADTIETTPWDSIVKHYTVLKHYKFTRSDMEKNNWTITYP